MATGTSADVIIPISEEPENCELLNEAASGTDELTKPRIQRVALTLKEIESNKTCFEPLVVSFGPYYHGVDRLKQMERYKKVAARWFSSLATSEGDVYQRFVSNAPDESVLKGCYADKFKHEDGKEVDFMKMMFLDGCFILHFIHLVVNGSEDAALSKMGKHLNRPLIIRDMFLLENQIPYSVLQALMRVMDEDESKQEDLIEKFISMHFLPSYEPHSDAINIFIWWLLLLCSLPFLSVLLLLSAPILLFFVIFCVFYVIFSARCKGKNSTDGSRSREKPAAQPPSDHLLDLLRSKLIGEGSSPSSQASRDWDYYFRPIRELKAIGIQLKRSKHGTLKTNVKFNPGSIISYLELPQIIVDDSTKTRLLNLVAYEMCPDGVLDCPVTTYMCFLNSLIHNAGDVKELRTKNILLNRLGRDEDVAKLFKEMATNLSPDYNSYSEVMEGIQNHKNNHPIHLRLWIAQLIQTYFSSPWTLISLIAATSVIVLTLLQTIYSILSYKKGRS